MRLPDLVGRVRSPAVVGQPQDSEPAARVRVIEARANRALESSEGAARGPSFAALHPLQDPAARHTREGKVAVDGLGRALEDLDGANGVAEDAACPLTGSLMGTPSIQSAISVAWSELEPRIEASEAKPGPWP